MKSSQTLPDHFLNMIRKLTQFDNINNYEKICAFLSRLYGTFCMCRHIDRILIDHGSSKPKIYFFFIPSKDFTNKINIRTGVST